MLRRLVRLSECIFIYLLRLFNFCLLNLFIYVVLGYHIRRWNKVVYIKQVCIIHSASYTSCQRGTARMLRRDRLISPGRRANSSSPAAAAGERDRQTDRPGDGQTDARQMHRPLVRRLCAECQKVLFSTQTTHTHTRLTALCPDYPGEPVPGK